MSGRVAVFAFALFLGACSQGGPAQSPADASDQAQTSPPATTTPAPAAPQAPPPGSAPTPESAVTGEPGTPGAPATKATPPGTERQAATADSQARFRGITIPAGTTLRVRLSTAVASDTSDVEDEVRGTLASDLVVDGVTVVPAGAELVGTVRDARRSGRVKGRASVSFRFERLIVNDESHPIRTAAISREAASRRGEDVKKGAIGAGAGAVVGGILGGGKGAAIGAGVGGAGAVMATRGDEVRLPAGTTVRTRLQEPVDLVIPRPGGS